MTTTNKTRRPAHPKEVAELGRAYAEENLTKREVRARAATLGLTLPETFFAKVSKNKIAGAVMKPKEFAAEAGGAAGSTVRQATLSTPKPAAESRRRQLPDRAPVAGSITKAELKKVQSGFSLDDPTGGGTSVALKDLPNGASSYASTFASEAGYSLSDVEAYRFPLPGGRDVFALVAYMDDSGDATLFDGGGNALGDGRWPARLKSGDSEWFAPTKEAATTP